MADITAGVGRYDKYDPISGGFRAALAADMDAADTPIAVGLDASGEVVPGVDNTGIVGVVSLTKNKLAGDIIDVMTAGEMVEIGNATAGTDMTANTVTGVISDTAASATQIAIGWMVEATRLIVRKAAGLG
jgi:hypothetical protein